MTDAFDHERMKKTSRCPMHLVVAHKDVTVVAGVTPSGTYLQCSSLPVEGRGTAQQTG